MAIVLASCLRRGFRSLLVFYFLLLVGLWLSSWGPATEVAWDPCWSSIFFTLSDYGYRPGVLPPRWLGIPAGLRFSSPCRTYGYRPGVLFTEGLLSGLGIPAGLRFFFFFFSAAES